jgi:flagellin-like protein
MESVMSNRIYLWSKRFGAILLIAMAIVAAGNAQQSSTNEKANAKNHL